MYVATCSLPLLGASPLRAGFLAKFANERIILCVVFAKRSFTAQNALIAPFSRRSRATPKARSLGFARKSAKVVSC
jgi:hypothetical protein